MKNNKVIILGKDDIQVIHDLEKSCFLPALQASPDIIEQRFSLGHTMLGIKENDELIAMIGYYYGKFNPDDLSSFPENENALCLQPHGDEYNAIFIYNLEVLPNSRGRLQVKKLLQYALNQASRDDCIYGIGNARIPSYGGSDARFSQESVKQNIPLKNAIDHYLAGGEFPTDAELIQDPILALYYRITKCEFLWILPNYAAGEKATDGIRVIVYGYVASHSWC